ncbi:anti-sigma factor antagonist [Streptomyces sp. ms191]|uniref:STAS domain-containing protein n=1 Tax=unclassified Streptomyces TaxID=2593676 RepID=UPI0011CDFC54|nr:STAS domain-containing protein [Streptomyces sp. ms191]TXS08214.1 anti-sigma factor antagonist [Streptomyces sp. ms191]
MPNLEVFTHHRPDITLMALSGEMDLASCPALEQATLVTPARRGTLHMDLSGVTFMDSSGVNLLLRLRRRLLADGGRLLVTGLREQPSDVLHVTGVDTLLDTDRTARLPAPRQP